MTLWTMTTWVETRAVPKNYLSSLDHYGVRRDIVDRPELKYGSYEFVLPDSMRRKCSLDDLQISGGPRMAKDPRQRTVFVIEMSHAALRLGILEQVVPSLIETLSREQREGRLGKVAIIGMDSSLHFFTKKDWQVMVDVDDPVVPFPRDVYFVDDVKELDSAKKMLHSASESSSGVRIVRGSGGAHSAGRSSDHIPLVMAHEGNCLGAALECCESLLEEEGGRVFVVMCSVPGFGVGSIAPTIRKTRPGEEQAVKTPILTTAHHLGPRNPYFENLSKTLMGKSIVLEMFACTTAHVGLTAIGMIPFRSITLSFIHVALLSSMIPYHHHHHS
jgi:hypothetical protein